MKQRPGIVTVSLEMPVSLRRQILAIAGKEEQSFSAFVRKACKHYLDGRPVFAGSPKEAEETARLIRKYIVREARAMAQAEKAKQRAKGKG